MPFSQPPEQTILKSGCFELVVRDIQVDALMKVARNNALLGIATLHLTRPWSTYGSLTTQ